MSDSNTALYTTADYSSLSIRWESIDRALQGHSGEGPIDDRPGRNGNLPKTTLVVFKANLKATPGLFTNNMVVAYESIAQDYIAHPRGGEPIPKLQKKKDLCAGNWCIKAEMQRITETRSSTNDLDSVATRIHSGQKHYPRGLILLSR